MLPPTRAAELLRLYDEQLRTEAETTGAQSVRHLGPLWLVTFGGGRGFITYRSLDGPLQVGEALEHFRADPAIEHVEWKTRGHDVAPGLAVALGQYGFTAGEPESVMIGDASGLAGDVPLPDGVVLRQVHEEADVRAMVALQEGVFGGSSSARAVEALLDRRAVEPELELWVAEAEGRMIGAGRLEPVAGTAFAGVWGGATLPAWRGRGVYRALTAARARSALARAKTLVHSDSTEHSRPILERSGLLRVTTTTPWFRTR